MESGSNFLCVVRITFTMTVISSSNVLFLCQTKYVIYQLLYSLVGYLPFSADYKEMTLKDQILTGRYRYSQSHWQSISLQGKLLMKRMLTVQVGRRITLNQILNHSWMQVNIGFQLPTSK